MAGGGGVGGKGLGERGGTILSDRPYQLAAKGTKMGEMCVCVCVRVCVLCVTSVDAACVT